MSQAGLHRPGEEQTFCNKVGICPKNGLPRAQKGGASKTAAPEDLHIRGTPPFRKVTWRALGQEVTLWRVRQDSQVQLLNFSRKSSARAREEEKAGQGGEAGRRKARIASKGMQPDPITVPALPPLASPVS